MDGDGAGVTEGVVVPDRIEELFPTENLIVMLGKVYKEVELFGGELYTSTAGPYFASW